MSDWQERITRETAPAIRAEHELRYALVAPLIATSAVWADLGCGTGLAARAALGDRRPQHAVLVDLDEDAVAGAAAELAMPDARRLAADLTDPHALARIETELKALDGDRVVSCFEVVEHLRTFVPFIEWAGGLARAGAATFVLSVPNDAFWSIQNPYHAGSWGQGAFDELCRLLPAEHTLLRQVALTGSAVVDWDASAERHELAVQTGGEGTVATHFLAAFGPRHAELERAAVAVQTEMLEQRRWERQRESNLAAAEAELAELRAVVQRHAAEFTEWRTYIHELERQLGRPLSGVE